MGVQVYDVLASFRSKSHGDVCGPRLPRSQWPDIEPGGTKELVFSEEYSGGPCQNFTILAVRPYKIAKQQHNASE